MDDLSWGSTMFSRMIRIRVFTLAHIARAGTIVILASLIACSNGSSSNGGGQTPPQSNPLPAIASISPSSVAAGSSNTVVTITGQGFINATSINVDGAAVTSDLLSSTQIQITIS